MSPQPSDGRTRLAQIRMRIDACATFASASADPLLAVSKTQTSAAIRELAAAGQRRFGENYVQEAVAKRRELSDLDLEWHLIGPLQSNKCRLAAQHFDWVQSVDREKIAHGLARERDAGLGPLNVLVQVNIDDETSKSGCREKDVLPLAAIVAAEPRLRLRGVMSIPAPVADLSVRRDAFRRLRQLFERVRTVHPSIDTLSMGMSEDFELALQEGATMVRIGSALFGPRPAAASAATDPDR
jgi:PLP dependent protein